MNINTHTLVDTMTVTESDGTTTTYSAPWGMTLESALASMDPFQMQA